MNEYLIYLGPFITLFGGVLLWFLNERSKRKQVVYLEKIALYKELLQSVYSFYEGNKEKGKRQHFNNQIATAWVYASKEVIEKADNFLRTVETGNIFSDDERSRKLDEFVKAIRRDMDLKLPETKFRAWISK